jgi:hypothetical protein
MEGRIRSLIEHEAPRHRRLDAYYRNPMRVAPVAGSESDQQRPYELAQEWGIPSRITGRTSGSEPFRGVPIEQVQRKSIVIENDIGWRIDTQVDFLFHTLPAIEHLVDQEERREEISGLIADVLDHHGGLVFLRKLALVGAIHGFVDVCVKLDAEQLAGLPDGPKEATVPTSPGAGQTRREMLRNLARCVRWEIVAPSEAIAIPGPLDEEQPQAYAIVRGPIRISTPPKPRFERWWRRWIDPKPLPVRVEIMTPGAWSVWEEGRLVAQGTHILGRVPVVHIRNSSEWRCYSGASDVEALIPIQDELNTRMSDRAHRIAMQSFRMYVGVGIENFLETPVAPGRMWSTDNEQARVIELGGDARNPSEDRHIRDLREAMDKISSVTPIAAGAIRGRIGRLTSGAALRVTLLALIARTERKRTLYGRGVAQLVEMTLDLLDRAGLFATTPTERDIRLHWSSPIPQNDAEKLQEARARLDVGVPRETVLQELGYAQPGEEGSDSQVSKGGSHEPGSSSVRR